MPQVRMLAPAALHFEPDALLIHDGETWAGGIGGVAYWNGETWQPRIGGLALSWVLALVKTSEWLIAGGLEGIARSRDGGLRWDQAALPTQSAINALLVMPPDQNGSAHTLFAASVESGVLKSEDDGATWMNANFGIASLDVTALAYFKGVVFAASSDGIYRSPNQGRAWKLIQEQTAVDRLIVSESILYAYSEGDDGLECLSTHDGMTWELCAAPPDDAPTLINLPNLHDLRRIIVTQGHVLLAGRHTGVVRLNEAVSDTWQIVDFPSPDLTSIGRLGNTICASGRYGLFRSDDAGNTWIKLREGEPLSHLSFLPNGIGYGCTVDGSKLVRTPDGGITWQETPSPFGVLPIAALQATEKIIFAAVFDPRRQVISLWRSTDGGQRWFPGAEIPSQYPIAASWGDPAMIALPGVVLVSGADPTAAWVRAGFDTPDVTIRAFAGDSSRLYALSLISGVFVSEDRGAHWRHLPLDLPQDELMDIHAEAGRLYVLMVGGRVAVVEPERVN